jgi:hypothetical protein
MNAIKIADKLISVSRIAIFSALISLPLSAQAEYYLVYGGPPEVACDYCGSPRPYVYKVKKVKTYKYKCHKKYYKTYYKKVPRRRSHYSITVYYPVPVYPQTACCGGFLEPTYYWVPAPYRVYYSKPSDRLVGNSYQGNYYDPSLDTGTADNDIY